MSERTPSPSALALVKPKVDTPFHIDYEWWERNGLDTEMEVRSHLCARHREVFAEQSGKTKVDWVNEQTGEVTRVDGPQHALQVHCCHEPDYLSQDLPLVDVVLRVLLANGNTPQTCTELAIKTGYTPQRILRTLAGGRVYKGIRPART
jgi:hypothetical protein